MDFFDASLKTDYCTSGAGGGKHDDACVLFLLFLRELHIFSRLLISDSKEKKSTATVREKFRKGELATATSKRTAESMFKGDPEFSHAGFRDWCKLNNKKI